MRKLAPEYIDVRHVYSHQDPEQIKALVEKVSVLDPWCVCIWSAHPRQVTKRLPWITRYEDRWPVEAYAKRWLDTTRWRYKRARPLNGRAMLDRQGIVKEAMNEPQARRRSLSQSEEHHPDLQEVLTIVRYWNPLK